MIHVLLITLLLVSCSVNATPPRPGDVLAIENPSPPVDIKVVNRLWHYIKKATGAPVDLPAPPIVMDWQVPQFARMGTQYPTVEHPNARFQISIAPRTVDMWESEMVLYGIGHELVHYAFILKENNWDTTKKVFTVKWKHHCDSEFKAITKGVADEIWNIWHSSTTRAKMYDEIVKSCSNFPDQ